jgi:hypothetical protein
MDSSSDEKLQHLRITACRCVVAAVLGLGVATVGCAQRACDGTSDATKNAMVMSHLKSIRAALHLYSAQHGGVYPPQLTDLCPVGSESGRALARVPPNPYTGSDRVLTVASGNTAYVAAGDLTQGWWYNSETGEVRCHVPDNVHTISGQHVNRL